MDILAVVLGIQELQSIDCRLLEAAMLAGEEGKKKGRKRMLPSWVQLGVCISVPC
jgi:hypothetical protein